MNSISKVYCTEYILFLVISIIILIGLLITSKKYLIKKIDLEIKICAAIWLIFGILNRIAECYDRIYIIKDPSFNWKMLLPFTICSTISIVFPIILLFSKKDSKSLHFFIYASAGGSLVNFVYPAWIADMPSFWNFEVWMGLLHHWMMLFVTLLFFVTNKFKPNAKMFYIAVIGYCSMILYGLFLYTTIFNYTKDISIMNINKPLLDVLPNLSSWWGLALTSGLVLLIFLFIYEKINQKITFKEFIFELLHLNINN